MVLPLLVCTFLCLFASSNAFVLVFFYYHLSNVVRPPALFSRSFLKRKQCDRPSFDLSVGRCDSSKRI
uniref:Putative secreted peptide n=1 Tax=Anopheles braziliensis TaxID=58242 RepID=A0A2M3ZSS6_9DIPT